MIGYLASAAINGQAHGASGYLITDWGDYGPYAPGRGIYLLTKSGQLLELWHYTLN